MARKDKNLAHERPEFRGLSAKAKKKIQAAMNSVSYDHERIHQIGAVFNKNTKVRMNAFMGYIPAYDLHLKMEMQDWQCAYCKEKITYSTAHCDHVEPLIKGGEHYLYNVVWTCKWCNLAKHSKTLKRFCKVMDFDYEAIRQEIADVNYRLHIAIFGKDDDYVD